MAEISDEIWLKLSLIEKQLADAALGMAELRAMTLDLDTRVFVEVHTSPVAQAAVRVRKLMEEANTS